MIRRVRRGVTIVMVGGIAVTALAGCTQRETKGQYESKVTAVYQLRQRTIAGMASNGIGDIAYFTGAKAQIDKAVTQLQSITPPKDVQQAHAQYIQSLQAMSSVLGSFGRCAALQKGNPAAATQCRSAIPQSDLDTAQNDFQDAEQIYRQAGYDLPQLAGN